MRYALIIAVVTAVIFSIFGAGYRAGGNSCRAAVTKQQAKADEHARDEAEKHLAARDAIDLGNTNTLRRYAALRAAGIGDCIVADELCTAINSSAGYISGADCRLSRDTKAQKRPADNTAHH